MLLAVLELAERGALTDNRIPYVETLEAFDAYFDLVRRPTDQRRAYLPFLHLRGDRFWHLQPRPGVTMRDRMTSHTSITETFEYASLDPDLHALLLDPHARHTLRAALIERWFQDREEALWGLVEQRRVTNEYEHALRHADDGHRITVPPDQAVRDPAFRRLVLEAYDYRCAASGWRLVVPGGPVLADAAHLIPFSETQDDHPRNGITLTPTFHRALDACLIAPGPDMKWHVSEVLDRRIPDNGPLVLLAGEDVIFHGNRRYRPRREALEWRIEHLRTRPE